jgi:transglutaminase-like putative cysteine protease
VTFDTRLNSQLNQERSMRLFAGCDMSLQASEPCPTVAMLRPRSGIAQWLASESYQFDPPVRPTEYVDTYGNLCQRFEIAPGPMRIRCSAIVETDDFIAVEPNALATPVSQLADGVLQFLLQSRYCPSDKMCEQARQIAGTFTPGYTQVEAIRAWVHQNIHYQYGVSAETTDATDTLNARAGVCRDFSHIGISLCRALHIPARMVVGYLYQLDPMDLHAWFEAYIDGRWYTFDGTQDQPRGGRIVVAYGRDAADVAFISNYGGLTTTSLKTWVQLDNGLPIF